MAQSTQHELQLARRMSRLGTETAFEVLNKARALERQGKSIIHLEIGEPDFDTPANVVEAAVDALHQGLDSLRSLRRPARAAPDHRRLRELHPRREGHSRGGGRGSGRQAHHLLYDSTP
jgi:hypothetical protein